MATAMDLLIEKMNALQDICAEMLIDAEIDLPQIVVIGSQSSGKTSVLENIVGRDFLPRGAGIVTRRPLVVQMIYAGGAAVEYCEFGHTGGKRYADLQEVKREIVEETNRAVRTKSDVSSVPIILRFYSPRVLSLTLVDLPGLVKVPTGDQPRNICAKIEEMCRRFVSKPNAIILAVTAANTDISNSDALQLAQSMDPSYQRTVGVLTKLDIMDKGTDVLEVLGKRKIDLQLGFVPVVCRSQADILSKKDIAAALRDEKRFFETHPAYAKNRLHFGTQYLVQKLHGTLYEHIRACLPQLRQRIEGCLAEARVELECIGTWTFTPREFIFRTICDISRRFSDVLKGASEISSTELCGGARLSYTFHHHFSEFVLGIEALGDIDDEQIRTLLYNASGSSSNILLVNVAFEKLARQSVERLRPHALKLVGISFNEVVNMMHRICRDVYTERFPALHESIARCFLAFLRGRMEATQNFIDAFISWNAAYINARNPVFEKWRDFALHNGEKRWKQKSVVRVGEITFDPLPATLRVMSTMTESEIAEVETVKSLVGGYFSVIKEIVIDQVPKAIMSELVLKAEGELQSVMIREVYEAPGLSETLEESNEMKERREICKRTVSILQRAHDVISTI